MIRFAVLIALLLASPPALAQDERPTGYPRSANERAEHPVTVSAVYTADIRGNIDGGATRGTRYLDNLDLQVAVDADRLVGWHGARMFVYGIYDNGRSISALAGDVQGISNIETEVKAARLFEAWVEQDIGRSGSVKVGLYNLNAEFDTTQSGGVFLLSSHGIGPDISQSGRNGPSIFPVTSLAVRGEAKLGTHWLGRDGALIVGELDYLTGRTKAAIGLWSYTARFEEIGDDRTAGRGNRGGYVFAEHRLTGTRDDDARGMAGWLRLSVADTRYNMIGSYAGGGLVYTGLASRRPSDQVGLSFASANFGERYRRAQRVLGKGAGRRELVIEGVYNAILTPWLSIQPDIQYVLGPGGDPDLDDALIIGLRIKVGR